MFSLSFLPDLSPRSTVTLAACASLSACFSASPYVCSKPPAPVKVFSRTAFSRAFCRCFFVFSAAAAFS